MSVIKAFNSPYLLPWNIRNRWVICINLITNWSCVVSHIFRDDNNCADELVNLDLNLTDYSFFNSVPISLKQIL